MNRHRLAVLIAAALLILGSVAWFVTGDSRSVTVTFWIWATPLVIGCLLALVVGIAAWCGARTRAAVAKARAEAADGARRAHRTFVSRHDHELKNPVTALRMGVTQVADDALAASLAGQVERLASLVTDLRKITEIEDYPIADEQVELREVVEEVVEAAESSDRKIDVSFQRAPRPVPPVRGDRDLLYLALHNVVSNAIKYSQPGATIEIRGREGHGTGIVEVSDTGRGIAAPDQATVWDELARGTDVRHIPGSGLGLAMVAGVMRRLGGSADLTSVEGRGTTVRLELPLA